MAVVVIVFGVVVVEKVGIVVVGEDVLLVMIVGITVVVGVTIVVIGV
jgi:hypothetical protein